MGPLGGDLNLPGAYFDRTIGLVGETDFIFLIFFTTCLFYYA